MTERERVRVLCVDDEPHVLEALRRILRRHFDVATAPDAAEGLATVEREAPFAVVVSDLRMPGMDGVAFLSRVREVAPDSVRVLLTGQGDLDSAAGAVNQGQVFRFLLKPCAPELLLQALQAAAEQHRLVISERLLYLELQRQKEVLEERVRERTAELERAQLEILERLARAGEYRDDRTGQHALRVGDLSAEIAEDLGLPPHEVELIRRAAPLHDLGKIGVPDAILRKPGALTAEEMAVMRTHTAIGAKILSGGSSDCLRLAERIALTHHERWNGTGYTGTIGEAIPLEGRIVAVADAFDALTHERPYQRTWSVAEAVEELARKSGSDFDPQVIEAFLRVLERRNEFSRHCSPGHAEEMNSYSIPDRRPLGRAAHSPLLAREEA